jgi:hypothetical protein
MGTTIESNLENEQVKAENKKLRRELRETRQAAIFSAVELLHRIGVSGDDAEKMWRGELSANAIVTPNVMSTAKMLRNAEPYAA